MTKDDQDKYTYEDNIKNWTYELLVPKGPLHVLEDEMAGDPVEYSMSFPNEVGDYDTSKLKNVLYAVGSISSTDMDSFKTK